jgi:hypothetical protein
MRGPDYEHLPAMAREESSLRPQIRSSPFSTARTVRVRTGKRSVSDCPAVLGEEFLTGYVLIEAETFDAAIEWAAKIPNADSGSVEVRPVMEGELADRIATTGA